MGEKSAKTNDQKIDQPKKRLFSKRPPYPIPHTTYKSVYDSRYLRAPEAIDSIGQSCFYLLKCRLLKNTKSEFQC